MSYLAVDLGLKTTGWSLGDTSGTINAPASLFQSPMTDARKHARLCWWCDVLNDLIRDENPSFVIVEAPFIHPRNKNGAIDLIQLHGVLRSCAHLHGKLVHAVENRTLKKWAVGNGNAPKGDMVLAAAYMADRPITDHNEADAVLLHHYWEDRYAQAGA